MTSPRPASPSSGHFGSSKFTVPGPTASSRGASVNGRSSSSTALDQRTMPSRSTMRSDETCLAAGVERTAVVTARCASRGLSLRSTDSSTIENVFAKKSAWPTMVSRAASRTARSARRQSTPTPSAEMISAGSARLHSSFLPTDFSVLPPPLGPLQRAQDRRPGRASQTIVRRQMCHGVGAVNDVITSSVLSVPHGFPTRDGRPPQPLFTVHQVHSDRVVQAGPGELGQADALWTQEQGAALGIKTADCVPLLLEDPVGRRVAAVHAGWRGAIAEIPLRAIEALVRSGTEPSNLRAALGPSIRTCCYVVGEDLAERFERRFGASVVERRDGK